MFWLEYLNIPGKRNVLGNLQDKIAKTSTSQQTDCRVCPLQFLTFVNRKAAIDRVITDFANTTEAQLFNPLFVNTSYMAETYAVLFADPFIYRHTKAVNCSLSGDVQASVRSLV